MQYHGKGAFSTAMKKVLIEDIEAAGDRAKTKEAYANPSSTVHMLTDNIINHKK